MLVIGLVQGPRLDWFASPLICLLLGGGTGLLALFLYNEWSHPLPFFKLQLLANRNLTYALITLGGVLFVLLAVIMIPSSFLAKVQGYRPLQTAPMLLWVALPQLIALPVVATLLNQRGVDSRWVQAIGLALLALACGLGAQLTTEWHAGDPDHRPADGGAAVAAAGHRDAGAHRWSVRLGLVQHGQGLCRGPRRWRAGSSHHRAQPPAFDRAGRSARQRDLA